MAILYVAGIVFGVCFLLGLNAGAIAIFCAPGWFLALSVERALRTRPTLQALTVATTRALLIAPTLILNHIIPMIVIVPVPVAVVARHYDWAYTADPRCNLAPMAVTFLTSMLYSWLQARRRLTQTTATRG